MSQDQRNAIIAAKAALDALRDEYAADAHYKQGREANQRHRHLTILGEYVDALADTVLNPEAN